KISHSMTQCCRKKNVGKPCEGKPHARFDEGKEGLRPLTYSTKYAINNENKPITANVKFFTFI
ncbi:MAG: hypothetical protein PHD56_13915, partial [Anaerostipes sp.]|nr:hypothetical protein [Anaerostipes sp.]